MKLLRLHPDDVRWLSRRIRSNLVCVVAIFCFLTVIRSTAPSRPAATGQAPADQAVARSEGPAAVDQETALPPESELALLDSRRPVAVPPQGWRRSKHGWEHVSTWRPIPRPLGQIIESQFDREPAWARDILERLCSVPPLMFALIQITAIAAIVKISASRNELTARPVRDLA